MFRNEIKKIKEYLLSLVRANTFTPLEKVCLECFLQALSPDLRITVQQQLNFPLKLIRLFGGRVVWINQRRKDNFAPPPVARDDTELHVATIKFTKNLSAVYAEIVFMKGVISAIEFSKPPKHLWPEGCHLEWTRLLVDLSRADDRFFASVEDAMIQLHVFSQIASRVTCDQVRQPAPESTICAFLERLNANLPLEFVDLVNETDGFQLTGGNFYGTRARTLQWPREDLILVVEDDEGKWALAFRVDDQYQNILFLDKQAVYLTPLKCDFIEAFEVYSRAYLEDSADFLNT